MKCLECSEEAVTEDKLCLTCQEWKDDEPLLPDDMLYHIGLDISEHERKKREKDETD